MSSEQTWRRCVLRSLAAEATILYAAACNPQPCHTLTTNPPSAHLSLSPPSFCILALINPFIVTATPTVRSIFEARCYRASASPACSRRTSRLPVPSWKSSRPGWCSEAPYDIPSSPPPLTRINWRVLASHSSFWVPRLLHQASGLG